MSLLMMSPHELAMLIAQRAKAKRLSLNLSQISLSERSGVSHGTLKKFERTGQISLMSLLKLALILNAMEDFAALFSAATPEVLLSLDELMRDKTRKRGRK